MLFVDYYFLLLFLLKQITDNPKNDHERANINVLCMFVWWIVIWIARINATVFYLHYSNNISDTIENIVDVF